MKKRTKRIEIRLTDSELKQIKDRKTKPRLAEWLRDLALNQKPKRQPKTVDPKLLFELNRIGVNLNQIAKHCNNKSNPIDAISIGIDIRSIEEQLKKVMEINK